MNSKGYMRISREIEKWGWYRNANTFRVFFHLLLKAQYQDGEYMGEKLLRGQVATGRKQLSADLGISEQGIRTAIDHLIKSGEINQRATNRFTIITICNFDSWMCFAESTSQQINQRATNEQPTTSDEINHIQRIKELEERNKKLEEELNKLNNQEKEKSKKEKDESFEECWLAYNRKGAKAKAFEYWQKLSDKEKEQVLPHIKVYVSSRERVYQKDFERYLRDKVFKTIIVKGNDTIYDPEQFSDPEEYRPVTDGIFQVWNAERKCLLFNGFVDQLNDGYTSDNRPDGAKIASGLYEWIWSSQTKEWVKQ